MRGGAPCPRYAEAANYSCGSFPFEVDEGAVAGLTTLPTTTASFKSGVPRIAEAAVAMECTLESLHEVKNDAGAPGLYHSKRGRFRTMPLCIDKRAAESS